MYEFEKKIIIVNMKSFLRHIDNKLKFHAYNKITVKLCSSLMTKQEKSYRTIILTIGSSCVTYKFKVLRQDS
jgi:hypothetical protein